MKKFTKKELMILQSLVEVRLQDCISNGDDGTIYQTILEKITEDKTAFNIAATLVAVGCNETLEGNYIFTFSKMEEMFDIPCSRLLSMKDNIEKKLLDFNAVSSVDIYEDEDGDTCVDLTFYLNYCDLGNTVEQEE